MDQAKSNSRHAAKYALAVLFLINMVNFFDRLVIGAVGEPIRKEFALSDASLGLLSTAFTLLYAFVGIPFGRLADKFSRKKILSAGVLVWSLLTSASGIAQNFWQLFTLRLGVGVGEASCAPAATSLIADLFPQRQRARAMSIFMLGLPIGISLSFAISGTIAKAYGWRMAFLVAGIPGVILGGMAYLIREPARGATDPTAESKANKSVYGLIFRSPVMRWLIISGAIHNFSLYALSFFLTPYLIRYHKLDVQQASFAAMTINGIMTIPGLLLGGWVGDAARRWREDGALIVLAAAVLLSAPLFYFSFQVAPGSVTAFLVPAGAAFALMYYYYAIVYAAVQDAVPPEVRATAMSVYFLVMYVLGGALGPYAVGALSDYFTRRAASIAGMSDLTNSALETFRAEGLHSAMYVVPILSLILAFVIYMASRSHSETTV